MGETGLVLMDGAKLSKSLIQFSVDGQGCVPSLLFDLRPNYGEGNDDNGSVQFMRSSVQFISVQSFSCVQLFATP